MFLSTVLPQPLQNTCVRQIFQMNDILIVKPDCLERQEEVIDFVATSQRFAPHFHIPLQSGSDVILQRMRRRYDTALYADRVAHIRRVMPHACIGVDVITGTHGETQEEFQRTHVFLRSIPVDYLHVFTYSERPNTPAIDMEGAVDMEERRRRNTMLTILSEKKRRCFYEQHLGQVREVLFEHSKEPGLLSGFTDNYIRIEAPLAENLVNTIAQVELLSIGSNGLVETAIRQNVGLPLS